MKKVCVLLVNWNGWGDTLECLESLDRSLSPGVRIIVVDNASSNGSMEKIIAWAEGRLNIVPPCDSHLRTLSFPPVPKPVKYHFYNREGAEAGGHPSRDKDARLVLIQAGENLGFAGGNNVGLRYVLAQGSDELVWLLNNDTVIEPGTLDALVERMDARPDAGMCGSTLLRYENPEAIQARGGGWYCRWIGLPWHIGQLEPAGKSPSVSQVERWMNYIVGASMLVRREFLSEIGLMTEDYFLYFEETDWAERSRGKFSLAYAPDSRVFHKVGRSIGTSSLPGKKSLTCDYYALRNRLLFTRRYHPVALPTIYLGLMGALGVRLLLGQWDRVRMIWLLLRGQLDRPPEGVIRP